MDYAYILAPAHSGSTLLAMLLASHPQVVSVGETSAVHAAGNGDTGLCSCAAPLDACAFWTRVRGWLEQRGIRWDARSFQTTFRAPRRPLVDRLLRAEYRGPLLEALRDGLLALAPGWRKRAAEILRCNEALIEAALALRGARVFVDSSKQPHRLKFLLRSRTLRTRVIHLLRDGRGVTASYIRKGLPVERAVDEWRRSVVSEEHILRRMPAERVTTLRYEALCADAEGAARRLWDFLGVDSSAGLSHWPPAEHHVLGNRMRLSASEPIRSDERWRTTLGRRELDFFERSAGAVNRRYGYEPV